MLAELLIVLTIFVLLAAIVMPRLAAAMHSSHLDAAFSALKDDVVYVRTRAVSSGLRHQLLLDSQSGQLVAAAYHPEQDVAAQAPGAAAVDAAVPALQDQLPEDVKVVQWQTSPTGYAQGAQGGQAAGALRQTDGVPIVFYPEGRSDDARIILEGEDGDRRGFVLDGFSGDMRDLEPEELSR
jgi:Tfp pilus assembly protein FimT